MKKNTSLAALACLLPLIWGCSHKKPDASQNTSTAASYALYALKQQPLQTTLLLPAELAPFEEVSIYPRVTGYVKSIPVDIGSAVRQGQTLMDIDAPDVEENSLAAQERYNKALASYRASRDNYIRLLNTAKTEGAVSPNDLQAAQSQMQSDSALSNSEKALWMAMESLKEYLTVKAPFDGVITQRNIHPGALLTVGNGSGVKPLLELQQISKLRLQVKVPENFATQLENNQTVSFSVEGLPGKKFSGKISRQAHSLDDTYRSESFEIDVLNPEGALMPGMYADVVLTLMGHANAFVVPQSAVVVSTEKKYVIKVVDNRAVWMDVTTGNEDNGKIEIFGDLTAGDSVVEKATDEIKQSQAIP